MFAVRADSIALLSQWFTQLLLDVNTRFVGNNSVLQLKNERKKASQLKTSLVYAEVLPSHSNVSLM